MPSKRRNNDAAEPKRTKPPLYRRRWFQILFAGGAALCIAALVGAYLVLKPHYDKAQEIYDRSLIGELEIPSRIYDRHGVEIGQIKVENRRPITIDAVPWHFVQALTAAEDSRFFEHSGIDYIGIGRAMLRNVRAGKLNQGASTISQQLANRAFGLNKNKDVGRKLTEAFLAARLEKDFSKREILEHYLNRIYFGSGYYGIEAASRGYFGKPASELSLGESATLAGLIKSPGRFSPKRDLDASRGERDYVLARMHTEGMIDAKQLAENKRLPLELADGDDLGNSYVNELVRQQVIDQLGFEAAGGGGFAIHTTIDAAAQEAARESLRESLAKAESHPGYAHQTYAAYFDELTNPALPSLDLDRGFEAQKATSKSPPEYLQGAVLMIENTTGGIVAMVGGRDFTHSQFNRALQARRPVGTAFTPFVYAAAFSGKHFPGSIVSDKPLDARSIAIGGDTGILGEWGTETDSSPYLGDIPAREALVLSKNAATVRLGKEVGRENVVELARRAGIESPMDEYDKTLLGSSGATLDEVVKAFSVFPNGGTRPEKLHLVRSIVDAAGTVIFSEPASAQVRAIDHIAAYQVHSCLEEALDRGTGQHARNRYGLKDTSAAGKTGTAYDFTDLWFVGYNSEVTCGVWAGFDKPDTIYRGAFSNTTALPVWVDTMNAALPSFKPHPVPFPEGAQTIEICKRSGRRATDACYDEVGEGETRRLERSTYKEVVRSNINFRLYCDEHVGGDHMPEIPIASIPALDPSTLAGSPGGLARNGETQPVVLASATVIGDDPYDAFQPVLRARRLTDETGDGEPEVRRATPVGPVGLDAAEIPIHFDQPPPLEIPDLE